MNEGIQDDIDPPNTVILNIAAPEMIHLDLDTICRICASQSERIIGIYNEEGLAHDLEAKMNTYLPLKVSEGDTLPLQCCWSCASTVLAWHELFIGSMEADRKLKELQIIASKQIIETVAEEATKIDTATDFVKETEEGAEDDNESSYIIIDHCYSSSPEYVDYYETVEDKDTLKNKILQSNRKCKRRRRKTDITYVIFCDICNKGYTRWPDMERHRKVKHPNHLRSKNINIEDDEENTNATPEVFDYVCHYCDAGFHKHIDLKVHLKSQHGLSRMRRKRSEIIAKHFCDVCKKGFTRKYDMKKHKIMKHRDMATCEPEKDDQLNSGKVEGAGSRKYSRCDVCKKMFKYAYNLLRHQIIHTKAYSYFCHICAKKFPTSGGLRRHLNEHHYGVKKFSCNVCGKKFAANATKEEHMNIHTNNRPFVCDICGKAFKQKASLRSHKLFHTNNYKFSCNFCNKKFRRAYELKTHTWIHTGHRPNQCHLCPSKFRLGQDLKRHLKVHDKLNECVCEECGATFSQQKYLNNHKRSHKTHLKKQESVGVETSTDKLQTYTVLPS